MSDRDQQLQIILDGVADGIIGQDAHDRVLYANEAAAKLLGFASVEDVLGRSSAELQSRLRLWDEAGRPLPADQLPCQRVLRGAPYAEVIVRSQLERTGEDRWSIIRARAVYEDDGRVQLAITVFRDITSIVRQRLRREALLAAMRGLAVESDPERVLTLVLEQAIAVLGGSDGGVYRWNGRTARLEAIRNTLPNSPEFTTLRPGVGAVGEAVERREPVIINDYQSHPRANPAAVGVGVQAVVAAPLLHEGELLGAITVGRTESGRRFGPEDAEILELLAGITGATLIGLERAQLRGIGLAAHAVAHHLNNALFLATGYLDLLQTDADLPEHLRSYVSNALDGLTRSAEYVKLLTRVERIEMEETPLGPSLDLERSAYSA